jgi:hypothetical protein
MICGDFRGQKKILRTMHAENGADGVTLAVVIAFLRK